MLPSNNLIGPLPDLTALKYLLMLNVSNNSISPPIPPLPPSLVELDLSSSIQQTSDSLIIPDFSLLTQLTYLNISNNSLAPPLDPSLSPLPMNLQILDLSNNFISDPDTGAIPSWLLPHQLGASIAFVNLSLNYFCGFLSSNFLPPVDSPLVLDLRNNSFFCPLPTYNSSIVSVGCEPLTFRAISPPSGPTCAKPFLYHISVTSSPGTATSTTRVT
jgi:Leucine-rich repeat (LRR) protein